MRITVSSGTKAGSVQLSKFRLALLASKARASRELGRSKVQCMGRTAKPSLGFQRMVMVYDAVHLLQVHSEQSCNHQCNDPLFTTCNTGAGEPGYESHDEAMNTSLRFRAQDPQSESKQERRHKSRKIY